MPFAPPTRRDAMRKGSGGGGGGNAAEIADVGFNTQEGIQGFASQVATGYHKGMTVVDVVVAFAIVVIAAVTRVLPVPAATTTTTQRWNCWRSPTGRCSRALGALGEGHWQRRHVTGMGDGGNYGVHWRPAAASSLSSMINPPPTPYPASGVCR